MRPNSHGKGQRTEVFTQRGGTKKVGKKKAGNLWGSGVDAGRAQGGPGGPLVGLNKGKRDKDQTW